MKKIVQIVAGYKQHDGIGNVAVARVKALLNLGCQVTVICHEAEPSQYDPPAPLIHVVPHSAGWHQSMFPQAVRQAVIDADVVILDAGGNSPLATLVEIKTGRVIVDYHGMTPPMLIRDPGYMLEWHRGTRMLRDLRPYFDHLVTHSRFIQEEWLQTIGDSPRLRDIVLLFGNVEPVAAPKLTPLDGRPLRLLGVGRMFPNKNWELAIRAVERLKSRNIAVQLQHIGGGTDIVSSEYRAYLEALIAGLGLSEQVQLRGSVPYAGLVKAYEGADAVLLPSLHEGFALPAVEGLAYGKPVFAADIGALPETLGGAGVLFNPFDAVELADKISAYFQRPQATRQTLAETALARARALSQAACTKRFVDLVLHPVETAVATLAPTRAGKTTDSATAALHIELPAGFESRLPFLEGTAKVSGLTKALPATVRLTAHVVDATGRILQFDEHPAQSFSGPPDAPTIHFRLLALRSEHPYRVIFQLAEAPATHRPAPGDKLTGNSRPDLFGRPHVVQLPARTGDPLPAEQAKAVLYLMEQLAELSFELKYPTDTVAQKLKAFVAKNLTARLHTRYIQPHVELQGEFNRNFIELLGMVLRDGDGRPK